MAKKNDDFVKEITKMEEDFPQWYTDVILKTDLVDYSPVKGFMVIKPYGYALWEAISKTWMPVLRPQAIKMFISHY